MLKAKRNSLKTIKLEITKPATAGILEQKCLKTPANAGILIIKLA
jgi:hypothetical protein